jgi:WD40 repeat protein
MVGGSVAILDPANGQIVRTFSAHKNGLFRCAFSPSGDWLATTGQDGEIRLWTPEQAEPLLSLKAGASWVEQLEWSPKGDWLAVGAGKILTFWHPASGLVHQSPPLKSTVAALSWKADGTQAASAHYGGVQIWNVQDGKLASTLDWKTSLVSLGWSPDGRWMAAGTQELSVQIWELPYRPESELAMSGYNSKVRELAWHFSSRYLATGGGEEIMVWDCGGSGPSGTSPRILSGHKAKVSALAYQKGGHWLTSGDSDGKVCFWNARKSSDPYRIHQIGSAVTDMRWSADDKRIAIGSHEGAVAVVGAPV